IGFSARVSLTLFVATHVIILTSDLSTGSLTGPLHRKDCVSIILRYRLQLLERVSTQTEPKWSA
ncbi:hypothetical protein LCGC14_2497520, partial [marine sediment metagenome]